MTPPPPRPKIYHITHVDNLSGIIADGGLISDAAMIARGGPSAPIGMSRIKQRRLSLPVHCHPGDHVGDYVPFYFCPRSIMLYVIHCGNNPELSYRGGQGPIVHLEADLHDVVAWATTAGRHWAFSLSNAGACYTQFLASLHELHQLDWASIHATDFRSASVKEAKQAEFLLHGFCPWTLVTLVGVHSPAVQARARASISAGSHQPRAVVQRNWYY
ncbi:type II toxin-antitoxin system toxin DNA ADP-ribosyl transferase DarT [Sorangium sp. So ce233]|uniref:type II toxin-antitoxin system toxin DNA ADP-ribosyl transferase DarT n=1 Tax=Sorangium sp. So ce233 TaxID=3133290 RepID=UPI003F5F8A82